jgi:hypothetical protein
MEKNIIQKHKNIIRCDRCGNSFTTIANLRKHFNRKNICEPLLKNIPIEELKEKYKVRKGCFKCENCGKEYKSANGKYKHKKKCLLNVALIEKKNIDKLETELKSIKEDKQEEKLKREELEAKVQQLLLERTQAQEANAKIINNNNNSHNNTNNYNTINVIIKNYGEEKEMSEKEIKRLVEVAMKKCNNIAGVPWDALNHVLQQKHFNPKYPENQNLKLTNISSPIMDVYTNNKWRKVPFAEQIKIIIESLMEFIESKNHLAVNISKNYWEELYEKLDEFLLKGENKKYYNKVETSMKCQLYNETQDIMEHNKVQSQNTEVST